MCGIYCCISFKWTSRNDSSENQCQHLHIIPKTTEKLLKNRGPDLSDTHQLSTTNFDLHFFGNVLWQQGEQPYRQPAILNEHTILFNGDIYMESEGPNPNENDTKWLIAQIENCKNETEFLKLFQTIKGPFSIVYFNEQTESLYFMRDSLGRQSLLLGNDGSQLIITSVYGRPTNAMEFIELPPIGIFKLVKNEILLFPWSDAANEIYINQLKFIENIFERKILVGQAINPDWLVKTNTNDELDYNFEHLLKTEQQSKPVEIFEKLLTNQNIQSTCDILIEYLTNSIQERIAATPKFCKNCLNLKTPTQICHHGKIGILFSGGIDCTILAILVDRLLPEKTDPIDLLNVSFEKLSRTATIKTNAEINFDSPDRLSAKQTVNELQKLAPNRKWNLVEINITRTEKKAMQKKMLDLIYPLKTVLDDSVGTALWYAASGDGFVNGISYKSPCRVLIIGSGADELFGGYTRHLNAFRRNPTSQWECLEQELNFDWIRLPTRNLARDDRCIGDHGITLRAPYICESFVSYVRRLKAYQKCYHSLERGLGDKLLLRTVAKRIGLENVCIMKKRALQFGTRIADSKQNASDIIVVD